MTPIDAQAPDDGYGRILPSGWLHIRLSPECWAQLPPGFVGTIVPDEYIFHPGWNRERINKYWEKLHDPD